MTAVSLCRLLVVVVALSSTPLAVRAQAPSPPTPPTPPTPRFVQEVFDALFSLFLVSCEEWIEAFEVDATFSHPKFPQGVRGHAQLQSFCETVQTAAPVDGQVFRQDGAALLTVGDTSVRALVPYVYAMGIDALINSGYQSLTLNATSGLIVDGVEFWTRTSASLPPVYSVATPNVGVARNVRNAGRVQL